MNIRLIFELFKKEIILELRQKYALNGILLYVFSTLYIILIGFQKISAEAWITLYWIVILFASVNAGAKSFIQEGKGRLLYYYGISSPQNIILAKLMYNCILISIISIFAFLGFNLFFGSAVDKPWNFIIIMLLGSTGLAGVLTMVSAIASKARGSATLMTILSFPVIIPQLLLLIKLSRRAASMAISNINLDIGYNELIGLAAINMIVVIVSYMLFPYLWRD
jgi:heme exporter protein B